MTVPTTISKAGPYAGAGTVGPFPIPFRFLENSHLRVITTDPSGVNSTLVLGPDYTVAGAGAESGSVTLVAPIAAGWKLTVLRNVPATQEADYVQNDAFPAESHEQALDKLTMLVQQQGELLARALLMPASDTLVDGTIPAVNVRAMRYLSFDDQGRPVATTFDIQEIQRLSQEAIAAADAAKASELVATAAADSAEMNAGFVREQVAGATPSVVRFSGDGVETSFDLGVVPGFEENTQVYITGVYQQKDTYNVDGRNLIFDSAPPTGSNNIEVVIAPAYALMLGSAINISINDGGVIRSLDSYVKEMRTDVDELQANAVLRRGSYADLRAYSGPEEFAYLTDEGISGLFAVVASGTENGCTLIVGADGRKWKRRFSGEVMASWAGVSVSNSDNASAIMAALAAANPAPVRLPAGVLNAGKITLNSGDALLGMGSEATTLRLKNGANSDLLYAKDSDTLWGTNSTDCVIAPRLEGFTLDGNRANNTAGRCLAMYAERPIVHDVVITDAPDDGMRTEWSSTASESLHGLEGRFTKMTIKRNGGNGWRFAGPHDSHVDDVIIFSSSLKADRTYQNLWVEKGNARWSRVHSYSTADILPLRVQHSLLISAAASGNEFSMSHFEGGATNVRVIGNNNIIDDTCRVYYPWDGVNIALAGNGNIINPYCGEEYRGIGLPAARGVVFSGDVGGASGNYVDIVAGGCGGGAIDFGGSGGANVVRARGFNPLGTDVGFAATPNASDEVDIKIIGGTKTTLRQQFGYYNNQVLTLAGFGSTQADATQIPENVQLFKLNSGASGSGVRLPNATTVRAGADVTIFNTSGVSFNIYPAVGGNIAGLGVNAPMTIAPLKSVRLVVIDAAGGQWGALTGA